MVKINFNHVSTYLKQTYQRSAKLFNNIFERSPKRDYFLISKTEKLPIEKMPYGKLVYYSNADSYRVVSVGKKSNLNFKEEIITFYDKSSRPIFKYFKKPYSPDTLREYRYSTTECNGRKGLLKDIEVKTLESLPYNGRGYFNDVKSRIMLGIWTKSSDKTQSIVDINGAKKVSEINRFYSESKPKELKVTEYPLNKKGEPKSAKKEFGIVFKPNEDLVVENAYHSDNVRLPENDEFLKYRLLTGKDKCVALSNHYLTKLGVNKVGVKVNIPSKNVSEHALANFTVSDRTINWKCVPEHRIAEVAAHESEHAYQHAMVGRLGKPINAFEYDCLHLLGRLKDKNEISEANKYVRAMDTYPSPLDPDYIKKHDANYLEICADKAGKEAQKVYSKGQNALKKQFSFFPDNGTMF